MNEANPSPWSTVMEGSEHNAVNTALGTEPLKSEGAGPTPPLQSTASPAVGAVGLQQGIKRSSIS